MRQYLFLSVSFFFTLLFFREAWAISEDLEQRFGPRPLDGVYIEAIQAYVNPRSHHLGVDFGVWPLNPYYNGFSVNLDYSYYFNKTFSWEVVNFGYLYSVQTGLTAELAEKTKTNPVKIDMVNFVVSSSFQYTLAYGKFVIFDNHIRYFRSSLLLGPVLLASESVSNVGLGVGWGVESFISERLSLRFDIRDNIAFGSDHPHNLAFQFGTRFGL